MLAFAHPILGADVRSEEAHVTASKALCRCCSGLLLMAAVLAPPARAQNANTGELKGSVIDVSGALVPGAAVSIKNVQTGVVTASTTNQAGLYDVPFLAPGNYTVKFSKTGFRDFVREGIALQIETLQIDATLQLGVSTEEVVV